MDTNIEIKEEDPLSDDITSQDARESFTECVTMKTNSDTVLLDNDCEVAVKTEVISDCDAYHLENHFMPETVTSSISCEGDTKIKIEEETQGSHTDREFPLEYPVIKVENYNSDQKVDNKMEVKQEPWWMDTQTSCVSDDVKVGDFIPETYSRLCTGAVVGDSGVKSLSSAKVAEKDTSIYKQKRCEYKSVTHGVGEIPTTEINDGRKICNRSRNLKQENLKSKRPHKCNICEKRFLWLAHLKTHYLIHEGKKPHHCSACDKSFTKSSDLKRHNLIHEGKKPYQCMSCDKSFTQLSSLKRHNWIHDGMMPHQCEICNKKFSQLYQLKMHNFIHQEKKPYQCKDCNEMFDHLSHFKMHILIHEGKQPHQCKACDKSFIQMSDLKRHILIHEGKKPHKCKECNKSFTQLSDMKRHTFMHKEKKPHQCKSCDKSFIKLSELKRHNLIHEDK